MSISLLVPALSAPSAAIQEDESFRSYLIRSYQLQGHHAVSRFLIDALGRKPHMQSMIDSWRTCLTFLRRLPMNHPLSGRSGILNCLTTVNYSSYFGRQEVKDRLNALSSSLALEIGQAPLGPSSRLPSNSALAACHQCSCEGMQKFGFTWWRRAHQIPGVFVCHKHGTPLVVGCATCGPWVPRPMCFSLPFSPCTCSGAGSILAGDDEWLSERGSVTFAKAAAALLNIHTPWSQVELMAVMRERALLLYANGPEIDHLAIAHDVRNMFGDLYAGVQKNRTGHTPAAETWVRWLLSCKAQVCAVEHFVMLAVLLFGDMEKFHDRVSSEPPTSLPPALDCGLVTKKRKKNIVRAAGKLRVLDRNGTPDGRVQDSPSHVYVRPRGYSYRPEVQAAVREMYAKGSHVRDIISALHVGHQILKRIVVANPDLDDRRREVQLGEYAAYVETRRQEIKRYLGYSRSRLWQTRGARAVVAWLSAFDADWLRSYLDEHHPREQNSSHLDWASRDIEWSSAIPGLVQTLIDEGGVPRRVSAARVFRAAGFPYLVARPSISKLLPRTMEVLEKYVETRRAFRLRKMIWLYSRSATQKKRLMKARVCDRCSIPMAEFQGYRWLAGFPAE